MKKTRRLAMTFLLSALTIFPPFPLCAETPPSSLPSQAQEAFNRGLAAAQQQEWGLAIRHFTEAQKLSPISPPLLFNLGLAHAKAGRELAAIAWLKAYLASQPNASNAEAVRSEIIKLEDSVKGKIRSIFQQAIKAAEELSEVGEREGALNAVRQAQARAGFLDEALNHCEQISGGICPESQKRDNIMVYVASLAKAGDLEAAEKILAEWPHSTEKKEPYWDSLATSEDRAFAAIAATLLKQGEIYKAFGNAKRISNLDLEVIKLLTAISEEAAKKGDLAVTEEVLSLLKKKSPPDGSTERYINDFLMSVARLQIGREDFSASRATIAQLSLSNKPVLLTQLAFEQFKNGKVEEAESTAREILTLKDRAGTVDEWTKPVLQQESAKALAILGKHKEAVSMAEKLELSPFLPSQRADAFGAIAAVQVLKGDLKKARKTAEQAAELREGMKGERSWLETSPIASIAMILIEQGKIEEAKSYAKQIQGKLYGDFVRTEIAKVQVKTGDLAGAQESILLIMDQGTQAMVMTGLADAYAKQKKFTEALDLLHQAFEAAWQMPIPFSSPLDDLFYTEVEILNQAGINPSLSKWIGLAKLLSGFEFDRAFAQLREIPATSPRYLVSNLADIGALLGQYLIRIHALEKQLETKSGRSGLNGPSFPGTMEPNV